MTCFLLTAGMLVSCSNKKKDGKSGPGDTAAVAAPATPSAGKKGMTVAEAREFLDADAANSGKEVTVTAYSWGSNERMDDKIQLNLGDKKLEGMAVVNFYCLFSKDQAAAVKAAAKDALVTVSGKIAAGEGGVQLTGCQFVQ